MKFNLKALQPVIALYARQYDNKTPGIAREDLEQEIALKLWQERGTLAESDDPEAWAARIAQNHCRDLQRADKRRIKVLGSTALAVASDRVHRPSDQPGPQAQREANHEAMSQMLATAIARLPEADRTLFEAYANGEKQTDLAARLGLSHEVMWKRITRIRARLQEDLDAFDPQADDVVDATDTEWLDANGGATPMAGNPDDDTGEPGPGDTMFEHLGGTFRS